MFARFKLANRLYKNQDFSGGGAVLRQGFGLLPYIISEDSLAICQTLLFDIPYWMPTWEIMVIYLRYLTHLLLIRNPELPMFKMASSMLRLSERFPNQLFPAIRQITNIKADLYRDIRGENDLITLAARLESLGIDEENRLQRYNDVFASYNKFLDFAVSRFGESSDEAIQVENAQLLSLEWSKTGLKTASGLCERHANRPRLASGTPSIIDWSIERLDLLQQAKSILYRLLIKSGELESGISYLRESIQASECLQSQCVDDSWCPRTTCNLWQDRKELADHLSSLGRTEEAEATRKLISPPEYVRWLLQSDEDENPIIAG
ncbi:hypothetical protein CkaCkLH20_10208 [Colletotrichum karsti]|uniref:Uncharacterized protein n=1 Tax=Colletotrichum karsti TaxID=1095194 RepID=A0A9P6I028_9PEZI|nr:uncharacterized protein CkaCkLH20_10208 [Colletotrichum karsti]KAF9872381.1 hypothetical protein CkaCkLH20_10208 [Colletotrichum karsti]